MYTFLNFFNFQHSGRKAPFGGNEGLKTLWYFVTANEKQNKTNRSVKTGMKFKFLIE
jgi:hypothetical protein